MKCERLKNFGQLLTTKPSAKVIMASLTSVPPELGIVGTPKFLAKLEGEHRRWRTTEFQAAQARNIANPDIVEGIQSNVLAFYTTLIATCGREKALRIYTKLSEKMGLMMYEEFFPKVKDFQRCEDPWEALRGYFLEFMRTWEREGIARFEILGDSDSKFHLHLTDCALNAIYQEAGYPEVAAVGGRPNHRFLTELAEGLGGSFERESWICRGDHTCDWHFHRFKRQR
jgi:hypothetical protein